MNGLARSLDVVARVLANLSSRTLLELSRTSLCTGLLSWSFSSTTIPPLRPRNLVVACCMIDVRQRLTTSQRPYTVPRPLLLLLNSPQSLLRSFFFRGRFSILGLMVLASSHYFEPILGFAVSTSTSNSPLRPPPQQGHYTLSEHRSWTCKGEEP